MQGVYSTVGYRYSGFWRKAPLLGKEPDIASAIAGIFEMADPDLRGSRNPNESISASTAFSAHKSGECLYSPMLTLDFKLKHMLNVAVFRFTELLPELDKPDAVAEKIAMLNRTAGDGLGQDRARSLCRTQARETSELTRPAHSTIHQRGPGCQRYARFRPVTRTDPASGLKSKSLTQKSPRP